MPSENKKGEYCPVCGKFFYNLKAHMVVHDENRKVKKQGNSEGEKQDTKQATNSKVSSPSSKKSKRTSASTKKTSSSRSKKSSAKSQSKSSSQKKANQKKTKNRSNQGITKIKVVGVGGAGGNIITRMRNKSRIKGVEYVAINTDMQDLEGVSAHKKIHIGKALTKGMGAGMNSDIGRQAVEENRSEIGEILKGADIVFVTAGFGGGTGSGAAPVIADIAKKEGVLTIGIVTRPFKFEGSKRIMIAQEAIDKIKENVDALVVVPNDRVFSVIDKETSVLKAFACVDSILKDGVEAIADLINVPGVINVDFSDIDTILRDMGTSMIGVGTAKGQDRSQKVVQQAINSPLLETSIEGAKGVLFSIAGGRDLKMSEVNDIAKAISESLDPNAQVIFGATNDGSLKDKEIRLTVVATGFNGMVSESNSFNKVPQLFAESRKKTVNLRPPEIKKEEKLRESENNMESNTENDKIEEEKGGEEAGKNGEGNDSDSSPWDIPAFLRKNKKNKKDK